MNPRIGSLCTGYGGLEMAARSLWPGARVVWCSEYDPEPDNKDSGARFLKWRYPDLTNHGNLRTMQWEDIEPVDILTAGFPCQSISVAGRQRGTDDERWLFDDIAHGIGRMAAPPGLLLFENVPRLLTVQHGHAMARVVHRLAALGYVGQWRTVRASDVGACHRRERVVIVARHTDRPGGTPTADAQDQRHERSRTTRGRRSGSPDRRPLPADAPGDGRHEGRPGTARVVGGSDAALGGLAELGDLAQWGRYGPAVLRHALALGRAAPSATVPRGLGGAQRLNPRFVEWMMMVPDGHVTDCPELTVNQMLRILGNGVVPPSIALGAADLLRDLP